MLIFATVLMASCADLCTVNIEPILSHSSISQVVKMQTICGYKCSQQEHLVQMMRLELLQLHSAGSCFPAVLHWRLRIGNGAGAS